MKIFLVFFLFISFSCDAIPWPIYDHQKYTPPKLDYNRIYFSEMGQRYFHVIANDENGFVNIEGIGDTQLLYQYSGLREFRVKVNLYCGLEDMPDLFSIVLLDERKEFLHQIDIRKNTASGYRYQTSFLMNDEDFFRCRWIIFVF